MPNTDTFVKETAPARDRLLGAVAVVLPAVLALALACGGVQDACARWASGPAWPGLSTLVSALAAIVALPLAWRAGLGHWWGRPSFVEAWTLGAFVALAAAVMFSQHTGRVGGAWHAWLEDDPMVSMQYARHLAEGRGLVWTVGQRIEGFSNPLWTLIMAAVLACGTPRAWASAVILALNLALGIATLPAVSRLARALGASPLAAALAAAGLGLSFEWIWAAASGMESVAMACLCAWAFLGVAEARAARAPVPVASLLLAGTLGLLRFDGLLPAALIVALSWTLPSRRGRLADVLMVLAPVALWQVFRVAYYGAWIPNTVLLKLGSWPGRWQAGWFYILRLDFQSRLALWAALSALAVRSLRVWGLVFLVALGYGLTTGGDFYPGTRYLAWAWPLLWALAAAALCVWLPRRWAALGMAAAALFSYQAFWAFPGLMQGGWSSGKQRVQIAELLGSRVAPGERVASAWAGSFYFFSAVAGVDLLGKCDPVVAAERPDPTLGPTAHDKLDLGHSLEGLRPAWVLVIPPGQNLRDGWLNTAYDRRVWEDAGFNSHCKGEIFRVGGPWALCRCHWPSVNGPLKRG